MRKIVTLLLLLCPAIIFAAGKEKPWQTGVTLDTEHNRYFVGNFYNGSSSGTANASGSATTVGNSTYGNSTGSYSGTSSGYSVPVYRVYENYVIDSGAMVYLAQERMHWRWSKPARLTVNGPVKFFVQKRKIFILDEDGKEHEAEIVKQILKPAKPSSETAAPTQAAATTTTTP